MGRCRNLGWWKSFLWYAPQLSGASIQCFVILCSLWGHYWGLLQFVAGKDWGQEEEGQQRMKWLYGIISSMGMSLSKLWEIVKGRKPWHAAVHGVTMSQTWLSDWTATIYCRVFFFVFVCFLPVFPKDSPVHSLRWRWLQSLMTLIYLVYWYGKQYFISQLWKYSSREKYFIIVSVKETIPLTFGHWNVLCRWYVFAFRIPSVCRARAYIWMYCCLVIKLCLTLLWRHAC